MARIYEIPLCLRLSRQWNLDERVMRGLYPVASASELNYGRVGRFTQIGQLMSYDNSRFSIGLSLLKYANEKL